MDRPQRPPAPPRSYTETVEEDVQDATSSQLFSRRPRFPRAEIAGTDTLNPRRDGRPAQAGISGVSVGLEPEQRIGSDDVGQVQVQPQAAIPGAGASMGSHEDYLGARPAQRDAPRLTPENGPLPRAFSTADLLDESFRFRPPSVASTSTSRRSSRIGVRIEDWSERPNATFVKDVKMTGYQTVGSEGSGFVVFDVELQTLPTPQSPGTILKIHKRYSAFVQLRHNLLASYPQFRGLVPRLPPKSSLAKYRPSFLEKRRQLLGYWLSTVLLHPILGGTAVVRVWVLE
ncbi:PX domain-containing protein ypt35 [Rhodotorula mucilaginosa]|uniref:Endosomal/vacuolar adapter protein YPT35 n=1 Tax=Rhodotorula mucilaginosa TaxID=5537 RepID=A0A9P7B463_RHOMI|nr:PX domain-containing protein ypt35 [Rhodotorula mucilaginosa]